MNVLSSVLIELLILSCLCFFFKQKTAYEMRISDWIQTCALPIFPVPFEGGKVVLHAEAELDREIDTDSANRSGLDCVGHGSASSGEAQRPGPGPRRSDASDAVGRAQEQAREEAGVWSGRPLTGSWLPRVLLAIKAALAEIVRCP